jgi:protein phosphatase
MFDLAMLSDVGGRRANNEDACGHWAETPGEIVIAIADGVGGSGGGEVASRLAVDTTLAAYRASPSEWGTARRLARAAQEANLAIYNHAAATPGLGRMATTMTAAAVKGGLLSVVHAGDCRLYLLRNDSVRQLTRDHNLAGERARFGLLSAQAARQHRDRAVLTRSLGRELIAALDRVTLPLVPGDQLVLCSDGLYTALEDRELARLCRGRDALAACRRLIEAADRRGTTDNLTAVVLSVFDDAPAATGASLWGTRLRSLLTFAD